MVNVKVSWNVLSRWAQHVSVFSKMKIAKNSDQISKNGLQLKLKLHQLCRIAMCLTLDCS